MTNDMLSMLNKVSITSEINIVEFSRRGIFNEMLLSDILTSDAEAMLLYDDLGEDVTPVYTYYDYVKDNVKCYLSAVYVGVPPSSTELLMAVKSFANVGVKAEADIDVIKQKYAYAQLYGCDPAFAPKGATLPYIKRFYSEFVYDAETINGKELHFWWDLIPSTEYVNHGSIKKDVVAYYEQGE